MADDCADCTPSYLEPSLTMAPSAVIALSCLPFFLSWIVTVVIAQKRLFPALSGSSPATLKDVLPFNKSSGISGTSSSRERRHFSQQQLGSLVFASSIGFSTVLVEVLLCEITETLNPYARGWALRATLWSLLVLTIVVTPAIEIHGVVKAISGSSSDTISTRRPKAFRFTILLEFAILAFWMLLFWYLPQASILRKSLEGSQKLSQDREIRLTDACLERVGIIGISLMASLAGFAAVSSLWQTFGIRHRTVKEGDLARKQAGLDATQEMLSVKQSRIRALQRKMSEPSGPQNVGFVERMVESIRGNSDTQEIKALQMEISGLEVMQFTLSSSLSTLRARYAEQQRSRTTAGRLINVCNTGFAIYCAYRIGATSISSLRRWWQPSHSFATSDPINNLLAILTTHWDGELDRAAWTRQISFLLSGIMLMASFSAVLQTFRLFARFAPALVQHAQTSLPLIISQIAGAYVISSALLLSSNLPEELSNVITESLGAPLDGRFVESWFESWFLVSVGLTATGILIGRKVGNESDDDYEDDGGGGIEMGKLS